MDQTGAVTTLSDEYLNVHGLTWNGDEIWYTAADEQQLFRALCAVTPGGARRTITRMPGNATLWDASPDGRLVIAHTDDRAVVITRRPEDVDDRDLSWLDASWVADLSHDGRLLLFTETGQGGGPTMAVYLRGTDGSPAVRLGAGRAIALSPDARLAVSFSANSPSPYLELLPTGAGEPRRFPGNGILYTGARWLPDGKRIIVLATSLVDGAAMCEDLEQGRPTPLTPGRRDVWVVSPLTAPTMAAQTHSRDPLYPVDGAASRELAPVTEHEAPIGSIGEQPADSHGPATMAPRARGNLQVGIQLAIRNPGRTSCRAIHGHHGAGVVRFGSHRNSHRRRPRIGAG